MLADRLWMDVAIAGNMEMYAWLGRTVFDERELSELIGDGAIWIGWFGSFLAVIFRLERPASQLRVRRY